MNDMILISDQFERILIGAKGGDLWLAIEESGYLDLLSAEADGGAGLSLDDAFGLGFLLGRRLIDLPVVETMLARGLLGGNASAGMILLASPPAGSSPIADGPGVLARSDEALSRLRLPKEAEPLRWLRAVAAGTVALRMAGALQQVLDLTVDHAQTRRQFGREIGRFQAVQHQIAVMAEEVAATAMSARLAFQGPIGGLTIERCAVAKMRACRATDIVVAFAHAIHGAIGVSEEHALQSHSRRLRTWRDLHGGAGYWERELGRSVLIQGGSFLDFARGLEPSMDPRSNRS